LHETKAKISASMKGKTRSEDTKTRLSEANGTPVEILDLKNNITTTFDSIRQVAKALNIAHSTVLKYLKLQMPYQNRYVFTITKIDS
jgi:predicted transcriptional regulator YheO